MAKVVVVGGGISGLGAAFSLQKAGLDVSVLESGKEVGGRMRSKFWHDAWIDLGAEFITDRDTDFDTLARDLGIYDQRVVYPGATVTFEVWRDGKAHPLNFTYLTSFMKYGGMSFGAKLRLARMLPVFARQMMRNQGHKHDPARGAWCDGISVEEWLNKVSPEFLEYAVEPAYELYCGYEPHMIGRGFFVYLMTSYPQAGIFTFKEGLGQLTRTLGSRLNVTTGARVTRVSVGAKPAVVDYEVNGKSERREADMVVVAVQGDRVRNLVSGLDPARQKFFDQVTYTPHELPFYEVSEAPEGVPPSLFVPRKEDGVVAALGYERAATNPEKKFFRVCMKTDYYRKHAHVPDAEHLQGILNEAARWYPHVPPLVRDSFVSRWKEGLPVFPAGYCKAVGEFGKLPPLPGVAFAGDYLTGPSTGAAYASGLRAADQVLKRLG
ncbi:MAG: NAD(P)/FAD-dependent oxidoreductase [Actinomycetota bacterium]